MALATAVAPLAVLAPPAYAGQIPVPSSFCNARQTPAEPASQPPPEQFPEAGAPLDAPSTPYEIPFYAKLNGGFLQVSNGDVTATFGGPVTYNADGSYKGGQLYAQSCGVLSLPSQHGVIPADSPPGDDYNVNFQFKNPISFTLGIPGVADVPLITGYGSGDADFQSQILPTPAANGGLNVTFTGTSKATTYVNPAEIVNLLLPPTNCAQEIPASLCSILEQLQSQIEQTNSTTSGICTVAVGDLADTGLPMSEIDEGASGPTGLTVAEAETPLTVTSMQSSLIGPVVNGYHTFDGHAIEPQPVTGPITGAQAVLASDNFWESKLTPDMPSDPQAGSPPTNCSQEDVNVFNELVNLPSPPGHNLFYAPGTFGIFTGVCETKQDPAKCP